MPAFIELKQSFQDHVFLEQLNYPYASPHSPQGLATKTAKLISKPMTLHRE